MADETLKMKMADVIYIYSSALCVVLNKYILAVTSCGMDHRLKSVMLTNTLRKEQKICLLFA